MINWLLGLIVDCPRILAQVIVLLVLAEVGAYVMIVEIAFHFTNKLDGLEDKLSDLENRLLG